MITSKEWEICQVLDATKSTWWTFLYYSRTKRSHSHKRIQHPNVKKSTKPRTLQDTFNDLLSNIQKPLGIHHIHTILFSLPVNYFKDLRDFGLDKGGVAPFSPMYRLSSIICDVASFRLLKPFRSEPLHDNNRNFLHILVANKGIDAINISNILNRKEVVKEMPPFFKNQSVPVVSYSYTNSIGRKIFNYKEALQDINIEEYIKNLWLVIAPTLLFNTTHLDM